MDNESKNRVISFISRFDKKLRRVHFGAQTRGGETIDGFASVSGHFWEGEGYPEEGSKESTWAFLDHISASFRCRALTQKLEIFWDVLPKLCEWGTTHPMAPAAAKHA